MKNNRLDIVLPCYNPIQGWTEKLVEAHQELTSRLNQTNIRFILVNDGSSEGISPEQIQYLESAIPSFFYLDKSPNQGKGAALRSGMALSKSEYCIFTDVDFPYQLESLMSIFEALRSDSVDVAIGVKDNSYYDNLPIMRVRISRFLRFLARTFLRISITDTQCGLKGFNGKGRAIFLQTTIDRYLCDLEFILLADRTRGLRMQPIKVSLRPGVEFSKVNLRVLFSEGVNFMKVWGKAFFVKR